MALKRLSKGAIFGGILYSRREGSARESRMLVDSAQADSDGESLLDRADREVFLTQPRTDAGCMIQ
jgi:hypothetical protein